jgi:hypothetical protein
MPLAVNVIDELFEALSVGAKRLIKSSRTVLWPEL